MSNSRKNQHLDAETYQNTHPFPIKNADSQNLQVSVGQKRGCSDKDIWFRNVIEWTSRVRVHLSEGGLPLSVKLMNREKGYQWYLVAWNLYVVVKSNQSIIVQQSK
jgi:hypothetical protein